MKKKVLSLFLVSVMVILLLQTSAVVNAATSTSDRASQVIAALGIMDTDDSPSTSSSAKITRAEFAQMLVNISSSKSTVSSQSNVSLFSDVSKKYWAAGYIKVAINNGWMTGYLNGKFKPAQAVTLQEAVNAIVVILGYSNSDFTGSKNAAKMSLYYSKNLDENITKTATQKLTRKDCINLFYNTLTATNKTGTVYGVSLGYTLDSDGEINYLSLVNSEMEGPIIASSAWTTSIPFSTSKATFYRNGTKSSKSSIQLYDVLYYSEELQTVWAYSEKVTGTIKAVAPDKLSPTSITISGNTYTLADQNIAYRFSTLGDIAVGDIATVLLGKDGTVVGVLTEDEYNATVNGVVVETAETLATDSTDTLYASTYAVVVDSYGHKYEIEYDGDTDDYISGQIVNVAYTADGKTTITPNLQRYDSPISGQVNTDATVLGNYGIADDVKIIDIKDGTYVSVAKSRIAGVYLDSSKILYYSLESNGDIGELILNNVTGDLYNFGVITDITYKAGNSGSVSTTYTYLLNGVENTYTTSSTVLALTTGACRFNPSSSDDIINLTGVDVTAINGMNVVSYNETYKMSDDVSVYYLDDSDDTDDPVYQKTTLSSVSDLSKYTLKAYYDKTEITGGRIRVIIAQAN